MGIWAINGVSMLFSIACIMIDAILTGQFLGKEAVAASGLVQPVILLLNIVGGLFGPGLSIMCTRYMGMAIATALSYLMGFIVILTHFTKKDRVLKFSVVPFDLKEIKEVMRCSVASSISMGSIAVRGIIFNSVLLLMFAGIFARAFLDASATAEIA
ncbi:MAG: hypothetical protein K6E53_02680 [Lachnospiraceae bacterium]|nr:hypothetical protein [Lachnospiraceae bacterium]